MNLECLAVGLEALREFILHVGIARGSHQCRHPILMGDDVVDNRSRPYDPRPANEARNAKAALPVGILFVTERCGAAIGPSKRFSAVVGSEDDNGVICDAKVVKLFQNNSDVIIRLGHARAVKSLFGDHVLIFLLEARPNVHAGRIVPDEEWPARGLGAIHRVERGGEELLVNCFHSFPRQWTGVDDSLLANPTEALVDGRIVVISRLGLEYAARPETLSKLRVLRVIDV